MMLVSDSTPKTLNFAPIAEKLQAPSVYYSMVSADRVLHRYSRGYSDLTTKESPNEQTQYALFSATKPFTAMAILQLQEKGLLHINDKASKYLPEYGFLENVTIRQLLTHQSGLNNPLPLKWIHLVEEDFDYQAFSKNILQRSAKRTYKPGKKSAYSNLNYLVLGEIIEKVSGRSYQDYIMENVLGNNCDISFKWNTDNVATGYHPKHGFSGWLLGFLLDKKKYTTEGDHKYLAFKRSYINGSAYGGLIANADGVQHYLQQLLSPGNPIINEESKNALFEEQLLANGTPSGKSLGWFTGNLNGHKYVSHAGGGGGFYCEIRVYPELGLASFLLTNVTGFSDQRLLHQFDVAFIGTSQYN